MKIQDNATFKQRFSFPIYTWTKGLFHYYIQQTDGISGITTTLAKVSIFNHDAQSIAINITNGLDAIKEVGNEE
jgi:hypothetical protein